MTDTLALNDKGLKDFTEIVHAACTTPEVLGVAPVAATVLAIWDTIFGLDPANTGNLDILKDMIHVQCDGVLDGDTKIVLGEGD